MGIGLSAHTNKKILDQTLLILFFFTYCHTCIPLLTGPVFNLKIARYMYYVQVFLCMSGNSLTQLLNQMSNFDKKATRALNHVFDWSLCVVGGGYWPHMVRVTIGALINTIRWDSPKKGGRSFTHLLRQ